jgi:hypothetical protein
MPVAEDVDLVWRLAAAGWRVRYDPAARVAHEHPSTTAAWLRRRAVYGTGAAPLAARHGALVAPVVISPWSAAALALGLAGGPPGRAVAAGVLGLAAARLAQRLAPAGGPPPYGLAAALVVRGTAAGARTLARAATRHHWPLALAAAVASSRARRVAAAVAVADALVAAPVGGGPAALRRRPPPGGPRLRRRAVGRRGPGPGRPRAAAGPSTGRLTCGAGMWRGPGDRGHHGQTMGQTSGSAP